MFSWLGGNISKKEINRCPAFKNTKPAQHPKSASGTVVKDFVFVALPGEKREFIRLSQHLGICERRTFDC